MSPSPTDLLGGRYLLGERIGSGGVADVYRARDRVLDRDVAVKVLRVGDAGAPGSAEDTAARTERARFEAEARLLASLVHPGLVTLLDADTRGECAFLVMELVDGPTLRGLLDHGPLPTDRAGEIGSQVAAALAWAHARGVVHRDVKPANVLLDSTGRARLADFGIARLVDDTRHHTRTGFAVGTAAYLAPEQVQGDPVSGAADVYALGLILLEALTGEHPFPGTAVESARLRLQHPPAVPADLSPAWRSLLLAMTATDPTLRPPAAAVADELRLGDTGSWRGPSLLSLDGDAELMEVSPTRLPRPAGVLLGAATVAALLAMTVAATGTDGVRPGRTPAPSPVADVLASAEPSPAAARRSPAPVVASPTIASSQPVAATAAVAEEPSSTAPVEPARTASRGPSAAPEPVAPPAPPPARPGERGKPGKPVDAAKPAKAPKPGKAQVKEAKPPKPPKPGKPGKGGR